MPDPISSKPPVPPGPLVTLTYRVAPEKRQAMLAFLRDAFPFYERPGRIRMALWESFDEPNLFFELVAYADEPSFAADQQRVESDPEMREWLSRWRALVEGPVQVHRLRPVSGDSAAKD